MLDIVNFEIDTTEGAEKITVELRNLSKLGLDLLGSFNQGSNQYWSIKYAQNESGKSETTLIPVSFMKLAGFNANTGTGTLVLDASNVSGFSPRLLTYLKAVNAVPEFIWMKVMVSLDARDWHQSGYAKSTIIDTPRQCIPLVRFDEFTAGQHDSSPTDTVKLSWAWTNLDNDGDGEPDCPVDGFRIVRYNASGEEDASYTVGPEGSPFLDTDLSPGTYYDYRLYGLHEGTLSENYATAGVTTGVANQPPIANDLELSWPQGISVQSGLLPASDPDGDQLYYSIDTTVLTSETGAVIGNISVGTSGDYTIIVTDLDYFGGTGGFGYNVTDTYGGYANGSVTIQITEVVSELPVASNSTESMDEDGILSANMVATDPQNDTLTYTVLGSPQNGTLQVDGADGSYTYTPNSNWSGTDYFSFSVSDPGGNTSNTAQVTINVAEVNDLPAITLLGDNPDLVMFADPLVEYIEPGATVSDVEDQNLEAELSGSIVDSRHSGDYTRLYDCTDTNGGAAEQKSRTVRVNLGAVHDLEVVQGDPAYEKLSLSWSAPHTPQSGEPGYAGPATIQFRLYCVQNGSATPIVVLNGDSTSYEDSGDWTNEGALQPETEYGYWIVRHDTGGNYLPSQDGNTATGRTTSLPAVVPTPWYLSVLDGIPEPWHQCRLAWTPVVEETDITEFKLYQKKAGDTSWTLAHTVDVSDGISPEHLSHLFSDLDDDTQYEFYHTASNDAGESQPSNTAEYTTSLTPTGVITADMDEVGETGILTVTGVLPQGWGYTTDDPGSEQDPANWSNAVLITDGSLTATDSYAAGTHEVWVGAVGYQATPHYIAFNTYAGISTTCAAEFNQDNATVSCSVPRSSNDWQSVFYCVDYASWGGSPGSSLDSTAWIQATPDASGDFTINLSNQNPGFHYLRFVGSYNEDGVNEQCGAVTPAIEVRRWSGVESLVVTVLGDDGTDPNIEVTVSGSIPSSPHGWRYSTEGPPVAEDGTQLTDLSSWGTLVSDGTLSHQCFIPQAGYYEAWAQACFEDGTPILSPSGTGYESYGPFVVTQRPYTGLTSVKAIPDGDNVRIEVEGDFHHWKYSSNVLFTSSLAGAPLTNEGVNVPEGTTASFTPNLSGRGVVYVSAVDQNDYSLAINGGHQSVWTSVYLSPVQEDVSQSPDPTYDPANIYVSEPEMFGLSHSYTDEEEPQKIPFTMTSAELSTALAFTTEASLDTFFINSVSTQGIQTLLHIHTAGGPQIFEGANMVWDDAVADNFMAVDAAVLEFVATMGVGGLKTLAEGVNMPAVVLEWRLDEMYETGQIPWATFRLATTDGTEETVGWDGEGNPVVHAQPSTHTPFWHYIPEEFLERNSEDAEIGPGVLLEHERRAESDQRVQLSYGDVVVTSAVLYDSGIQKKRVKPRSRPGPAEVAMTYVDTFPDYGTGRTSKGPRWCPAIQSPNPNRDPWYAEGFVADADISSVATTREGSRTSGLPTSPGTLFRAIDINIGGGLFHVLDPEYVARYGDDGDWSAYVCFKEWLGADEGSNFKPYPLDQQLPYLQRVFDAEWVLTEDLPGSGQQRHERLLVVFHEAQTLGLDLDLQGWDPAGNTPRNKAMSKE